MKDLEKGKPDVSGTIAVTMHYQGKKEEKHFSPSATVEEVLDWALALKEFGIDPAMVNEFQLARLGLKDELPLGDHLGKIAAGAKAIELDLVRGDIANGAAW
jgi:hypothetical protein